MCLVIKEETRGSSESRRHGEMSHKQQQKAHPSCLLLLLLSCSNKATISCSALLVYVAACCLKHFAAGAQHLRALHLCGDRI